MKSLAFKCFQVVFAVVLCISMLCGVCFTSSASEVDSYISGDIDGDGRVNLNDIITLAQFVAEWPDIDYSPYTVDVNGDGKVDLQDVIDLSRYLIGWEDIPAPKIEAHEMFATKFTKTNEFLYRVGNGNAISLGSLFKYAGVVVGDFKHNVSVTAVDKNGDALDVYTKGTGDWTTDKIDFADNYTGIVTLTISIPDEEIYEPTSLNLEVIDAVNATTAASATANNVVLLNDVGISTVSVANGYTLYGNGFKMTATNDVRYYAMNVGFVDVENGNLDNVQIICPNFSHSVVYNKNISESANQHSYDTKSEVYGNVRSAVMVGGTSNITNSYIHGGRAAIFLRSGDLVVDNSTISGGAAANIHALSAKSLTLRDVTLIQKPYQATVHDTSKTIMGFSGLFECDESGASTPLILEGYLRQDAWVNESYNKYIPDDAEGVIKNALSQTNYQHTIDGVTHVNLGFNFIPQEVGGAVSPNITDNRIDKDLYPYGTADISVSVVNSKVYSYKNAKGTSSDFIFADDYVYEANAQGASKPVINFNDANEDRVFETVFDSEIDKRLESTLTVNLDKGNYNFNFSNLVAKKYGENLDYVVKDVAGNTIDKNQTIALTSSSVTEYKLEIIDNKIYGADGLLTNETATHTATFILVATKSSIPEPEVADTTGGTPLLVVKSKGGDWSCAIPALEGISVKYWDTNTGAETILNLATLTPSTTGKQNGTENFWEYTNGYKLKVSCGYIHDTKQIYGMPVVVNNSGNKMYFTISSTNGYVSTSTASRTVTISYEFTDPNGKTITFSKVWQFNYADYKNGTQYSYDSFVNGTLKEASSTCVTPDTLITLADGSQKMISELTGEEKLLVWNHQTGAFESIDVAYIVNHNEVVSEQEVIKLGFDDGSEIKIIGEHVFYDATLNKYVPLDASAEDYIGHQFIALADSGNELKKIKLVSVSKTTELTSAYEVVSYKHLTCFTNGILSTSAYLDQLLNIFDINADTLAFTAESVQKDIETYGLYTYDDFEGLISKEAFELYDAKYLKIAVGKGYITWDDILVLIDIYFDAEVNPVK